MAARKLLRVQPKYNPSMTTEPIKWSESVKLIAALSIILRDDNIFNLLVYVLKKTLIWSEFTVTAHNSDGFP